MKINIKWSRTFIALSILLIHSSFSEVVDFERTSRIVNSIHLDKTKITFDRASELLCEGGGTEGGEATYFDAATLDNSFLLAGGKLYVNGRIVNGFKVGEEYSFKSGVIYSRDGKALPASGDYLDSDRGQISMIKDGGRVIRVIGTSIGGGITEKCADDYMIWVSSYVCARVWDGDFILWGVNYGRVDASVEVNLKKKTVTIDKGKPVVISIK